MFNNSIFAGRPAVEMKWLLLGTFVVVATAQLLPQPDGELVLVQALLRHGARPNPGVSIPQLEDFWASFNMTNPGLTNVGACFLCMALCSQLPAKAE